MSSVAVFYVFMVSISKILENNVTSILSVLALGFDDTEMDFFHLFELHRI